MPKIQYIVKRFQSKSREIIAAANAILDDYAQQGFVLTLRQLYYQFVARDILANTEKNYKMLGSIISDARLAGLIDWNYLTDRTRYLRGLSHWDSPAEIIASAAQSFRLDKWENQDYRPEIWIEKDALVDVALKAGNKWDVPVFSCRGYPSQSEIWGAGQRLARHVQDGKTPVIFHFGDHDPSGLDMTRDIFDRLEMFMGGADVRRLALNMNQIEEFNPPPNPAKLTDTRANAYIAQYGNQSWELDALEPNEIVRIMETAIKRLVDSDEWDKTVKAEDQGTAELEGWLNSWGFVKWPKITPTPLSKP